MCFAVTFFPLSLFSFLLALCVLREGRRTDEWIWGFGALGPSPAPQHLVPRWCAGEASALAHRWTSGKAGSAAEVGGSGGNNLTWSRRHPWMCGQSMVQTSTTSVGGTWEAGFRPLIAAPSMLNYSQPSLGASCTAQCRSAACLMVCTALCGAAGSRKALCSRAKSECPMLASLCSWVLTQLLWVSVPWLLVRCALCVNWILSLPSPGWSEFRAKNEARNQALKSPKGRRDFRLQWVCHYALLGSLFLCVCHTSWPARWGCVCTRTSGVGPVVSCKVRWKWKKV